jgi:ankyrin repeat protein
MKSFTLASQMAFQLGATPNVAFTSSYGITTLVRAIHYGNIDTVELLLRHGADVNAEPCGLHYEEDHVSLTSLLESDLTALQAAAANSNPTICQMI